MLCVAEKAWIAMKYGSSLHAQAKRFGVNRTVLDRAIWLWRGRRTGSLCLSEASDYAAVERLAS